MKTAALAAALLTLPLAAWAADPAPPSPRQVEDAFCARRDAGGACRLADGQVLSFWWGSRVTLPAGGELYLGLATAQPAPTGGVVFTAPDATLPLYQASFRREGGRWIPASLQAGIGRIGTGGAGGDAPQVDGKAPLRQHALPGGDLILALRTIASFQGSSIYGFEIFRLEAARSQWRHAGTIPGGSDNGAACAPPESPCVTLEGSPAFDAGAAMARPGWPVIVMSLDRSEERDGRPVTLSGAERKRYGYDPERGAYRELGDN
ncbi:hypothetical protein [Roseomonas sp. USHLN139]|uniref:hypothetical protein n=1 Tax=Roseomonas sp. USHLN139 TaxID=3081298 RepID=UPI003B01CB9A